MLQRLTMVAATAVLTAGLVVGCESDGDSTKSESHAAEKQEHGASKEAHQTAKSHEKKASGMAKEAGKQMQVEGFHAHEKDGAVYVHRTEDTASHQMITEQGKFKSPVTAMVGGHKYAAPDEATLNAYLDAKQSMKKK